MSPDEIPLAVVALVADTHVPDRVSALHPKLLQELEKLHPDMILHAGDICFQPVLDVLGLIAPVYAVRGNRDWFGMHTIPTRQIVSVGGIKIAMMHGHGTLRDYFADKWAFLKEGYQLERYIRLLRPHIEDATVVVFGHTHRPVLHSEGNVLYFNPGSASLSAPRGGFPTFGILKIFPQGVVKGEFIELRGYKVQNHQWVKFLES